MSKVLLVEDDDIIARGVSNHLSNWQMEVCIVKNFDAVDKEVKDYSPDIILMDINLPFYNGFYWCSKIRKNSNVPIVFLSSASDNMNIVMAMNMGGDDFIAKPFDLNVLTAKLMALLRRTYGMEIIKNTLEYGGVVLNLGDTSLEVLGQKIVLTKNEYLILKTLLEKTGNVVSRDEIMDKLWGDDEFVDDNTLTVNITRIRKKLEEAGINDFIKTKRGLGYIIGEQ